MAKPLSDKKPEHAHRPGGGPSYPRPPYGGGYMGDPYGAYGGGPAFNQVYQNNHSDNKAYQTWIVVLIFMNMFPSLASQ
jgi:hypothetical protein